MTAAFTALIAIAADAATLPTAAQEAGSVEQHIKEATIQVGFVSAKSAASYQEALALAKTASSTLHLPLELRGLVPH